MEVVIGPILFVLVAVPAILVAYSKGRRRERAAASVPSIEEGSVWEQQEGWERIVCQPVLRYPMAARDARAILEAAGRLKAQGHATEEIVAAMRYAAERCYGVRKGEVKV